MSIVLARDVAAPGGHYSQAVIAAGLIFVSGQLPLDREGRALAGAQFQEQVGQALANLFAILRQAGSSRELVVRVTAYIVGVERWPAFNEVYAQYFGAHRPARTVVPIAELHHGCLVEIDAIARLTRSAD